MQITGKIFQAYSVQKKVLGRNKIMMNFALTEKQKEIQEKARHFAQREVAPGAQERDITEQFPMELVKKLGEEGLIGLQFSKEYGGHDIDYLSFILVVEELCKADCQV